jgi:excisionase family DNA binding protein
MVKKSAEPLVLLTVAEACLRLKVSRRTLYRMIGDALLPQPRRMGRFRTAYFEQGAFDFACRKALD